MARGVDRLAVRPSSRLIIDTDPGIDDVVTLALAALSPELEIVAVTTTYGNATVDATTRNARAILNLADRSDIPVYAGAARPLVRDLVTAPETHGESGVGYAPVAPLSRFGRGDGGEGPPLHPTAHPPVLLEQLAHAASPVTLVTLGPLTNLALALNRDADLVRSRVSRHVGMFGTIHAVGNTNRWADFNAWCDPEAADRVLRSGLPTEMIGLDVTRRIILSAQEVEAIAKSGDSLVSWLGQALRFYVEFHRRQERLEGCVVNDVVTVGTLLDPHVLRLVDLLLEVDLDSGGHRGHTRVAPNGSPVRVAMEVDTARMRALLRRVFGNAIGPRPSTARYREPEPPPGG